MKVYTIKRKQFLPLGLEEAWAFFATPNNLAKITPENMKFKILSVSGHGKMYAGQVIKYHVNILPFAKVFWMTEITHVEEPYFFVDEQRTGPYRIWHHQHRFTEVPGGVEMEDEINYAIPMGPIGQLANALFVKKQLNTIFDYRYEVLSTLFEEEKQLVHHT